MITKSIIMILLYATPLFLLAIGGINSPILALLLYVLSGFGLAGIGMGIMHDANHGAYSKRPFLNTMMARTLEFVGCSSEMWKLQHNVLHHTYTNIHGHDEDIDAPLFLLRFSPYSKSYKIHRFQHLYVWLFYSVLTLYWVSVKDFRKVGDYYRMGFIKTRKEYWINIVKLIPIKVVYFGYTLVLPLVFAPFSFYWILLGYLIMHLIAGLLLSVVFQLAHVVPGTNFPQSDDEGEVNNNWYTHQLQTTSNFSPKNPFLFWYLGGLTNQIEHHLFPNICHVHYRALSRIVSKTANEFKVPYHINESFFTAIVGHVKTLRILGKMKTI